MRPSMYSFPGWAWEAISAGAASANTQGKTAIRPIALDRAESVMGTNDSLHRAAGFTTTPAGSIKSIQNVTRAPNRKYL